jgi:hypothetical protein
MFAFPVMLGKFHGRDHNRGWLRCEGTLENALTGNIRFGWGPKLGNVDAEIFTGFARPGLNDLPVQRRSVFDDDWDRRFRQRCR